MDYAICVYKMRAVTQNALFEGGGRKPGRVETPQSQIEETVTAKKRHMINHF